MRSNQTEIWAKPKWGLGALVGKNAHPTAFLLLFRQPERFSVVMVGRNTHAII
ncbi:MAG: hypothetical protein IJ780_00420 [Neisseriaceae bacterium]|nr:hypothetical protein [Neisseriaceae bacterium]MBR1818583.1 hypothetical protein [Neisseriaceae bacterium]